MKKINFGNESDISLCRSNMNLLTDWERGFIESILGWNPSKLTHKQKIILNRIKRKIINHLIQVENRVRNEETSLQKKYKEGSVSL